MFDFKRYRDLLEVLVSSGIDRALRTRDQTGLSWLLMRATFAGVPVVHLDRISMTLVLRLDEADRHWWLEEACPCQTTGVHRN